MRMISHVVPSVRAESMKLRTGNNFAAKSTEGDAQQTGLCSRLLSAHP